MHILTHKYMYIYAYAQGPARPTYIHVCICTYARTWKGVSTHISNTLATH